MKSINLFLGKFLICSLGESQTKWNEKGSILQKDFGRDRSKDIKKGNQTAPEQPEELNRNKGKSNEGFYIL